MSETQQFLALARDLDITVVGIGDVRHPLLGNESFPHRQRDQIFTPPGHRINGWPAAWTLAKVAGIDAGCGNTGQRQADTTGLEAGVWVLLVGGEWGRVA